MPSDDKIKFFIMSFFRLSSNHIHTSPLVKQYLLFGVFVALTANMLGQSPLIAPSKIFFNILQDWH